MKRRVVVTGIGALTPIGVAVDGLWQGLHARRSAVTTVSRFDPSPFRSHLAAEVPDFSPTDHLEQKRARRLDRYGQFAVVAARMAVADAELRLEGENRDRVGTMMGTALGGVGYAEEQLGHYLRDGLRAVDATLALAVFGGAASCNIAIELGAHGPNSTNAMSCASGTIAIGEGFRQVRDGYADVMVCGGAEAPLAPLCFGAFALIRAMSTRNDDPTRASRPFDKDRDGFVMGEGAATLVLEERDRAIARGARSCDAHRLSSRSRGSRHRSAPRPDGVQAARAMRLALADGGVSADEIDYVNAHGSATPLNDPTETLAIRQVFGERTAAVPVSGTKGYHGHALGASGAIEAAICALALQRGWVPPTVNLETPGEGCDLAHVPPTGSTITMQRVISNSFGFGGINAALVMGRG
jgi:3-oxoacyl-[acyl-carrier-protein] synthase II